MEEIKRLINACPKTQTEIAFEIGYGNQNLITMFKRGVTRVPEDKIVPLATALGADAPRLVRLWCSVYSPKILAVIEGMMRNTVLSAQELSWIEGLREEYGEDHVPMFLRRLIKRAPASVG
ncbi:hypothetical protein [Acidisphaera sp. L21]|uniref:hypothetical protein n=1 Tax=Acidisphaera sp. L21 TaxID=1641851 RepID=UPI00131C1D91|nr:hypothetical protein [Acidisphaera sp. L21]